MIRKGVDYLKTSKKSWKQYKIIMSHWAFALTHFNISDSFLLSVYSSLTRWSDEILSEGHIHKTSLMLNWCFWINLRALISTNVTFAIYSTSYFNISDLHRYPFLIPWLFRTHSYSKFKRTFNWYSRTNMWLKSDLRFR